MKPRFIQTRHIILVIETGEICATPEHYDTASHALWDELYAILRGANAPFYKRVKGVTNIECQASYCMHKGVTFELLLELDCVDGQAADLSKPVLQKILDTHWGKGALVASKKVVPTSVPNIIQQALFALEQAPATFAVMHAAAPATEEESPATEEATAPATEDGLEAGPPESC
jgi:hypothetical protein